MIDNPSRPLSYVLAATDHGLLILNRFDVVDVGGGGQIGVSAELLNTGRFDAQELRTGIDALHHRRRTRGDGVVVLDVGANVGVFSVPWSLACATWGHLLAIEPQEWTYYALAGNLALNNCYNAQPIRAAIGRAIGAIPIARIHPTTRLSYGSVSLVLDLSDMPTPPRDHQVQLLTLDSLQLDRLDLLKVDVEGMTLDVLAGGGETIRRTRPVLLIETLHVDLWVLRRTLKTLGYSGFLQVTQETAIATFPEDAAVVPDPEDL